MCETVNSNFNSHGIKWRSEKLQRCSACAVARYCNAKCQRKGWKFHKEECKCLARMAPRLPTESAQLLLRLVLRRKWGDDETEIVTVMGKRRTFQDLMSHVEEIREDKKRTREFLQLCQTLKTFVGDNFKLPSPSELLQLFGKMCINSFTICDGEMQPIGVGVYLGPSILDHSCRPNAVATFSGTRLQIRNIRTFNEQDRLYISYIDQMSPTVDRRRQLYEQYYFTCNCSMCEDQDLEMQMLAAEDSGKPAGQGDSGAVEKAVTAAKNFLDKTRNWQEKIDATSVMEMYLLCLTQCKVLHSQNVYIVQMVDRAFDACIELTNWQQALDYGNRNLETYRRYYPQFHPHLGIHQMKIGKIELYLRRLPAALESLKKAESVLRVSHGTSHALYRDLSQLLDQCVAELKTYPD